MPDPSPYRSISPAVSDDTGAGGHTGGDPPTDLDLSFLGPKQGPDELGRLGRYVVRRVLWHGGMGVVFAADDPTLGRAVAVKCMLPEVAKKPVSRDRFLREARSAAAVRHDNVVPIYDISETTDPPFIVMPLLPGEPLDKRLARDGRRPVAEVRAVGRQIAAGLAAAHARGLIHRDLKPANVWLEAGTGRAVILDFGLARSMESGHTLTIAGSISGTIGYLALEQTTGDKVDHRADLFSLGCILYKMATGELPFGGDAWGLYILRLHTTPTRAEALNPEIPAELSNLIERLLAADPAGRPASAKVVLDALQKARTAVQPITASRADAAWPTPVARLAPPCPPPPALVPRRWPWVAVAGGFAAAVLVVFGIVLATGDLKETKRGLATGPTGRAGAGSPPSTKGVSTPPTPPARTETPPTVPTTKPADPPKVAPTPPTQQRPAPVVVRKAGDRFELPLPSGRAMKFAWCPPGTFDMGGTEYADEKPVHPRTIRRGFYAGVYEVTQAEWKAVMGDNPSRFKGDDLPVENVSWVMAKEFCQKVSVATGRAVRLPSEAEWEYACRAGTTTHYWLGDVPSTDRMNYHGEYTWNGSAKGEYRERTTPGGTFPANPWGLCDTHGNVWEWCEDYYDAKYYETRPTDERPNLKQSAARVCRGGSWTLHPGRCRGARRNRLAPGNSLVSLGFRVVFCLG